MLERVYKGAFHKLSPKHFDRDMNKFAGRYNIREKDTVDLFVSLASGMTGNRLTCIALIAGNGLALGARAGVRRLPQMIWDIAAERAND